ncbi:uncharacterized protein LOC105917836 [Fundulus heteroclitus]|uniref:uncharacterized protein LOC105917836 n=1 Tax=Fundulus heteroclitus TaxID=8078 RepID=UPI00165ADA0C|nr:uncharacterized protein LOC105917836 [Fundulus heteroclitus]
MFLPSSLSCQPSPVLADRGAKPLTNDQICDLIAAKIAEFRLSREYALFNNRPSAQTNPLLQPGPSTSPSALVRVPQTPDKDDEHSHSCNLTSHRCDVTDGRSPDKESLMPEVTLKPNKKDVSGILSEVAATCEKDEQSPVVLTSSCEKLMKSCLTLSAGSLQKDKTLDDKNGGSQVGSGLECFQQKKGDAVEEEGRVVGVAVTSTSNTAKDDPRKVQQNPLLTFNQQLVHSMSASSVDKTDKAGSPCSHLQNPTKEVEQNCGQQKLWTQSNTGGAGCVSFVMDPLYDNISDDEPPGLTKTSLQSEQYEDENVIGGKWAGLIGSILPVLSEASREPLENTQGETVFDEDPEDDSSKADTFNEPEIHSCQCSVEPAADSEHHVCLRCSERGPTNLLYGPCSVLNKEADDGSDEGEDSEDDWEVIPVSILDLKFEPLEKQPASGKAVQDDDEHGSKIPLRGLSAQQRFALKPLPASAFAKIAVFDTPDDQEQASRSGQLSYVTPSCYSPKQKSQMDRKELCSEPEDSCDTDDSFTYSSGPKCNYMTVPKELLESLSSPGRRKTYRCVPKTDQDVQKHRDLTMVQNRVGDGIINLLDSDEEAEAKTEERLSETWENWGVPSCTQRMGSPGSRDSESEDCVLVEDEIKQNDESVVIILSDSEDESRENYNWAKTSFTAEPQDCGRAASSTQARNAAAAEEPPAVLRRASADSSEQRHRSQHELGYQSSGPRVSSQESAGRMEELSKQREVGSPEAESNDDFPNDGKDSVPKRKKLKMTSCDGRLSAEADSTVSPTVIPRLLVREFKSGELVKDVGECREPKQAKSSSAASTSILLKERLRFLMNTGLRKPASPPSPANDAHRNACRRVMHAAASKHQRSHSSDSPAPSDHAFVPARFPSGLAPVQPTQGTHHARTKVHTDWQRQHVPLRREKKYKRKRGFRRPL